MENITDISKIKSQKDLENFLDIDSEHAQSKEEYTDITDDVPNADYFLNLFNIYTLVYRQLVKKDADHLFVDIDFMITESSNAKIDFINENINRYKNMSFERRTTEIKSSKINDEQESSTEILLNPKKKYMIEYPELFILCVKKKPIKVSPLLHCLVLYIYEEQLEDWVIHKNIS